MVGRWSCHAENLFLFHPNNNSKDICFPCMIDPINFSSEIKVNVLFVELQDYISHIIYVQSFSEIFATDLKTTHSLFLHNMSRR